MRPGVVVRHKMWVWRWIWWSNLSHPWSSCANKGWLAGGPQGKALEGPQTELPWKCIFSVLLNSTHFAGGKSMAFITSQSRWHNSPSVLSNLWTHELNISNTDTNSILTQYLSPCFLRRKSIKALNLKLSHSSQATRSIHWYLESSQGY